MAYRPKRKVIITCAVTGAIHTPTMSPHLPITPKEIAASAIEAAQAGAAIAHIHVRDPGTGNCEIHLDRRLYEKRVFPAIQLNRSGTRREELLLPPEILQKTRILRQFMYNMDEIEAMELMLKNMKATKSNVDFFDLMRRGG